MTSENWERRKSIKVLIIGALTALLFLPTSLFSQGWSFLGPDSVQWRDVSQIDVSSRSGHPTRIVARNPAGIAAQIGGKWHMALRNHPDSYPSFHTSYYGARFSPWNDSTAIIDVDRYVGEYSIYNLAYVDNTYAESTWTPSSSFTRYATRLRQIWCPQALISCPSRSSSVIRISEQAWCMRRQTRRRSGAPSTN